MQLIATPLGLVGFDEHVRAFERAKGLGGVRTARHRGARRRVEMPETRDFHEEATGLDRKRCDDLLVKEVAHAAKRFGIGGSGREEKTGDPALRCGDRGVRRCAGQRLRFGVREAEVTSGDLDHLGVSRGAGVRAPAGAGG